MDYLASDDVVFGRHRARKLKRTVNGGHTVGNGNTSSSTKMQGRQNEEGVGRDAYATVSHSSMGYTNVMDLAIWHLVLDGSMIEIEKCSTGLRRGNNYPSLCAR